MIVFNSKMLLKPLLLMMVCQRGVASEELLRALGGVGGGNRVSLCLGPEGARCPGALWRTQWVVARASCLDHRLMFKVRVLRDGQGLSCLDYDKGRESLQARKIRVKFVHPEYERSARGDVALLALSDPYWQLDKLANTSSLNKLLSELEPWMEEVYQKYPMNPHRIVSYIKYISSYKSLLFSTPLRMFITTIILPFVTFILFFLFVVFYTGPKDEIPYKSINCKKYGESEKDEKYEKNEKSGDDPLKV